MLGSCDELSHAVSRCHLPKGYLATAVSHMHVACGMHSGVPEETMCAATQGKGALWQPQPLPARSGTFWVF